MPGRFGIAIEARLGDLALTPAVTAIVENQRRKIQLVEEPQRVESMRDIAGIAMEE